MADKVLDEQNGLATLELVTPTSYYNPNCDPLCEPPATCAPNIKPIRICIPEADRCGPDNCQPDAVCDPCGPDCVPCSPCPPDCFPGCEPVLTSD